MNSPQNSMHSLPEDCAKQWEVLLLLLSSEEKKIERTSDTEIDTMNYFCNNEGVRKILLQWLKQMQVTYAKKIDETDTSLKCDDVSLLWRQRGNDRFRANNIQDSYKCYSQSVVYAEPEGSMYPLALANRSAALLRLKRFKECLEDVSRAISSGYPEEQRHKLLLRRADCLAELKQVNDARAALAAAADHAASLDLPAVHSAEFDRHIKLLEKKLERVEEVSAPEEEPPPTVHMGPNEDFVAASKALELRRTETAGRCVNTRVALRRGDVLVCESPYAWVALPAVTHVCHMCCQQRINCVPCTRCSRAVYCSESCRSRAAPAFHQWECAAAQSQLLPTIGIAHLALRVLLISTSAGFPLVLSPAIPTTAAQLFAQYSKVDDIKIYNQSTPPFYRMFNLVTNFDKMNNTDYTQYALTATLLTLYLESFTTFFEQLPDKVPYRLSTSELRLFSAALILRSLGQLVCNGHATLGLVCDDSEESGRTESEREERLATAIYPSAAMMNHSCEPNIITTFYKSRLIVKSSRELPEGAEIFNCYGPHAARDPAMKRREMLRAQYMFNCSCTACVDQDRKDFVLVFSAYACGACRGPVPWRGRGARCPQCRAPFSADRALHALDRAEELVAQAEQCPTLEQRCEKTHAALRLRQQAWHRHHAGLRAAADQLARLYAELGDFSKSVELIKQNIQSLEYQFGSFSVEVAHELRKLSDVMLERIVNSLQNPDYRDWCLEAHKIIKKAVQLMELNYGSWEPLVQQLKEQETFVASLLADGKSQDTTDVHHNLHYNLKI